MRCKTLLLLLLLACASSVSAQFQTSHPPLRSGPNDPATCSTTGSAYSKLFYNTTSNVWKYCSATDTWSVFSGGTGCTVSGSNNQIVTDDGATGCVSEANVTFNGSTLAVTGNVTTTTGVSTTLGTIASDVKALNVTGTFNAAGIAFKPLFANFTNTASHGGTRIFELQVGGTSQIDVTTGGLITMATGFRSGASPAATGVFRGDNDVDLLCGRNAGGSADLCVKLDASDDWDLDGVPLVNVGSLTLGSALTVANGGTGASTFTAGLVRGDGTNALAGSELSGFALTSGSNVTTPGKSDVLQSSLFCQDAGANDTYACNLSPAVTAYVTGTTYRFKANTANTGAASVNFNTVGALTIVKVQGGITTALDDNDIRAGQWVDCVYDGTNCQMVSPLGNSPAGSGTINSGVTNIIPKYTAATTLDDSLASDDGTTFSYTGTGGISAPTLAATGGGGVAGYFECLEGTAPSLVANSFQVLCPADVAAAGLSFILPGAAATGFVKASNSSGSMTLSVASILAAELPAASETAQGAVELATVAEIDTGTDTGRGITPDGLAGSDFGLTKVQLHVSEDLTTAITVGDGKYYFAVDSSLDGYLLVGVEAYLGTASSSGLPNIDLARCAAVATGNECSGTVADMLSTNLTIDANENKSTTAAAAAVIDTANDDLATGQTIRVDIDGAGTGATRLRVVLHLRKP